MRSLLLLRHAKSDWNAADGDDHNRPLAPRGRKDAVALGQFLAASGELPDRAITSPALRARDTLRLAMKGGGWTCPTSTTQALTRGTAELLDAVAAESDGTRLLLVVGHEPTMSDVTSLLIGGGRVGFPTGTIARVDLECDAWREIGLEASSRDSMGSLAWLVHPKLARRILRP